MEEETGLGGRERERKGGKSNLAIPEIADDKVREKGRGEMAEGRKEAGPAEEIARERERGGGRPLRSTLLLHGA